MADKPLSELTTRQKVTIGVFVVVIAVLIWQGYKIYSARASVPIAVSTAPKVGTTPAAQAQGAQATQTPQTPAATTQEAAPATPPPPLEPQKAQLIKTEPSNSREAELMRMQQETQAKYVAAINELQMLKVARDIAETNDAIMTARLSAVTSQKKIVDLLSGQSTPTQQPYSSAMLTPAQPTVTTQKPIVESYDENVSYVVVSVSQLHYVWNAVLGAKGVLYNVRVGDILPPDRSRVVSIDRSGVILQKNGVRRKISLVSII